MTRRDERVRESLETFPAPVLATLIERGYVETWPLELTRDGWRVLGSLKSWRQIEIFVEDDLEVLPPSRRLELHMARMAVETL